MFFPKDLVITRNRRFLPMFADSQLSVSYHRATTRRSRPTVMDISDAIAGLSLSPTDSGSLDGKHVVVDALNYLSTFMPANDSAFAQATPWDLIEETKRRVHSFLAGCKMSCVVPHFVIDCGFQSDEAMHTWMGRREKEVVESRRAMPYGADTILASCLLQEGADVIRPVDLDGDDVVVKWAVSMHCDVMSEDTDMLRYPDLPQSKIMVGFAFHPDGRVHLVPRRHFQIARDKQGLPPRMLDGVPLNIALWRAEASKIHLVHDQAGNPIYRRGNTDSFTKSLGNLHHIGRPLRAALYAKVGIAKVDEMYPMWDAGNQKPGWHRASTVADPALIKVLDDAKEVLAWLITHDQAPANPLHLRGGAPTLVPSLQPSCSVAPQAGRSQTF